METINERHSDLEKIRTQIIEYQNSEESTVNAAPVDLGECPLESECEG